MNTEQIQVILKGILQGLFPPYIWNFDYFTGLWARYSNFGGFFTGLLIIIIVYFASAGESGSDKKRGIIKVFALVALLNALDSVYLILMNLVNRCLLHVDASMLEREIHGAFNPLSILVLVLVISECYNGAEDKAKAFFFGVSSFSVSILMFGSGYMDDVVQMYLLVRVIIAGILCAICSRIAYVFVSYIVMGFFFLVSEATQGYLLYRSLYLGGSQINKGIIMVLSSYQAEYIIIVFFGVVFALYELLVLNEQKINIKKFALRKAALAAVLIVAPTGMLVYAMSGFSGKTGSGAWAEEKDRANYTYEYADISSAEASSSLTGKNYIYGIEYTFDGSLDTCWQDGRDGSGEGETLSYGFDTDVYLARFSLINGRVQPEQKYYENCRLAGIKLTCYLDGELVEEQNFHFEDVLSSESVIYDLEQPVRCDSVTVEVTEVYEGTKYSDLCVTEIGFIQAISQ